jgi:hypothetical protein
MIATNGVVFQMSATISPVIAGTGSPRITGASPNNPKNHVATP